MKRVVLKVGSAVLTQEHDIAHQRMQNLVDFIVELREKYEVILVTSGAVAAGYTQIQLDRKIVANRQALAAIGQPILMNFYAEKLNKYNIKLGQVLVTSANFSTYIQYKHIVDNIEALLSVNILPIINENDSTATQELIFGDNDQLSAEVTCYLEADILIILSDIDAYYDADPRKESSAKPFKVVNNISREELEKSVSPNSEFATGGIVTKLYAADLILQHDKSMFLADGFDLSDVKSYMLDGVHKNGTLFTKANS